MVSSANGRLTLRADELTIIRAVADSELGYADQGPTVDTFRRGQERITTVGPAKLIRPLVDAGLLTVDLGARVYLTDLARRLLAGG